ncbi:type I restriction-modification system subunit M N-terminal domain-containing protein [Heyndrickxia oleronia]|uniref:type I restriction-modification system subunit M N-terminal domain-containing protein n=1 Tax=Heyndrickxia oleronia TaxID=38875 RepID=UPI001B2C2766|nr:type I restriction-modification system subunit M N-terminal domain-containing protein [Heyndrickxia oleronia]GIN37836.1 hypothetical protein J19TS1_07850 [Heyndrickxia oleronia]
MDVDQFQKVLSKCERIVDGQNLECIQDILVLKILNDIFENERQNIREDFLLRGICSTEVDNLIDDPAYYQFMYIPKLVRWQQIKTTQHNDWTFIAQALQTIIDSNQINIPPLPHRAQNINSYQMKQLVELIDVCNFQMSKEKTEAIFKVIESWQKMKRLKSGSWMLINCNYA